MALEFVRRTPAARADDSDAARRLAADERAFRALEDLLGRAASDPHQQPAEDTGADDEIVDLRDGADPETVGSVWVTVADAAARAGVSTSTVRQWYRSGHLATQRRDGDRGAFLVPLGDVVTLAAQADETGDVAEDLVLDINAQYWAAETESARRRAEDAMRAADEAQSEARRLFADLEDAREQIESAREQLRRARADVAGAERASVAFEQEIGFLRGQLEESREEARGLHDDVARLDAALEEMRRSATFGSITSTAWVEEADNGYRGPLRRQAPFESGSSTDDAPEEPGLEVPTSVADDSPLSRPLLYGDADDDLLPAPETPPKQRRRR